MWWGGGVRCFVGVNLSSSSSTMPRVMLAGVLFPPIEVPTPDYSYHIGLTIIDRFIYVCICVYIYIGLTRFLLFYPNSGYN